MSLKASEKDTEGYQWNAIRAQYPLLADVLTDMKKRIRKQEIKAVEQHKRISALEAQVQPAFAEKRRRSRADVEKVPGDVG